MGNGWTVTNSTSCSKTQKYVTVRAASHESVEQGRAKGRRTAVYFPGRSEDYAGASGDLVGVPGVEIPRVAEILSEFQVARLVRSFRVPLAEDVSSTHAAAVAEVEAWFGEWGRQGSGGVETPTNSGRGLELNEGVPKGSESVFDNEGNLEDQHFVTIKRGALELAGRNVEFAYLGVEADRPVAASAKIRAHISGKLGSMLRSVGRETDLSAEDDVRGRVFFSALNHDPLALDATHGALDRGEAAEFVGGLTGFETDESAVTILTIGGERGDYSAQNKQIKIDPLRLATRHQQFPSLVGSLRSRAFHGARWNFYIWNLCRTLLCLMPKIADCLCRWQWPGWKRSPYRSVESAAPPRIESFSKA